MYPCRVCLTESLLLLQPLIHMTPPALPSQPLISMMGTVVPPAPPLTGNVDPSKIEEIRRTVYVGNLNSSVSVSETPHNELPYKDKLPYKDEFPYKEVPVMQELLSFKMSGQVHFLMDLFCYAEIIRHKYGLLLGSHVLGRGI